MDTSMITSAGGALLALASLAHANPTSPTVVNGSATFSTSGSTLTVTNSPNSIINWQAFSISASETTRFAQQSASSAVLNRVSGSNPSSILGTLTSNGSVFLVNPNGILFGSGAQVNVGGLVASTLDISNANFLAGNLQFASSTLFPGQVTNSGTLVATDSYIALIGSGVHSAGSITTGAGGIALAAGAPVSLTVTGGVLTNLTVGSNISHTTIDVRGVLNTTGQIFLQTDPGGTINWDSGAIISSPPVEITSPGVITMHQNSIPLSGSGSAGGSIPTAGGAVTSYRGPLVLAGQVQAGGAVVVQGTAGLAQVATTAGITLNLEKREVGF